jgi:hypothetical protein
LNSNWIDRCHVTEPFQTQFRGLASCIIPKIDVQVSTGIQLKPGTGGLGGNAAASNGSSLNANCNLPNAQVLAILGRSLVGGGANPGTNPAARKAVSHCSAVRARGIQSDGARGRDEAADSTSIRPRVDRPSHHPPASTITYPSRRAPVAESPR